MENKYISSALNVTRQKGKNLKFTNNGKRCRV